MNLFHPVKKWPALLISTALLGTLAADATAASDGKPILYGRIHVSLDKLDNEGTGPASATGNSVNAKDRWELNTNASRLGVKGELDLGDTGLTAIYLAEYEIDADDGATPFSQRNIYAGLQSRFGSITAGKNDTPFKQAEGKVDQFNDLAADIDALAGGQNRINNVITYRSPAWAGVTVNAAFSPGENADTDADGKTDDNKGVADTWSASVVFDNKTVYAALAYDGNQQARRGLDLANNARVNAVRVVGKLTLNGFEAGILLQHSQGAGDGSVAGSDSDLQDNSLLLSGAYSIRKFKIKAQAGQSKGDTSGREATLAAVGLEYALASKTLAHTYLSQTEWQDDNAGIRLKDTALGFGFSHSF